MKPGAMLRGYEIIDELKTDLTKFMTDHGFGNLREFTFETDSPGQPRPA